MWHNSDERKLKEFFQNVQQEPVPDTLHERLQAVVEARFARSSGLRRLFTMNPLVAAAAGLLLVVTLGTLLTTTRAPDGSAAVVEAMRHVRTAQVVGPDELDGEFWLPRDQGIRWPSPGRVCVLVPTPGLACLMWSGLVSRRSAASAKGH